MQNVLTTAAAAHAKRVNNCSGHACRLYLFSLLQQRDHAPNNSVTRDSLVQSGTVMIIDRFPLRTALRHIPSEI